MAPTSLLPRRLVLSPIPLSLLPSRAMVVGGVGVLLLLLPVVMSWLHGGGEVGIRGRGADIEDAGLRGSLVGVPPVDDDVCS